MRGWVNDPHSGGVKIPEQVKQRMKQRILAYAEKHYAEKYIRIDVRNGYFCYIDDAVGEIFLNIISKGSSMSEKVRISPWKQLFWVI
ncbi:hypothetical protein H6G94_34945 [Nostoc punctiforme FACHB-252]|uniref:Uncharacterized protein n=1 Tax=Nostoc punctiforme FACHB-252 TaxID=1357509 RepID=A0ABR8HKG9_NOSPU|nr:hypothetical protein [Nostoc punctiforme]MBD2616368.1 hypothetical protein [Nostoc punctiforme FACHB-252]